MLSFLKFRRKKSSKGNTSHCESSQSGILLPNSPPPQRHHSNRHLTPHQENTEDKQPESHVMDNSGTTGGGSTKSISGLISAKLQCDTWGLRSRGIYKKASSNHVTQSSSHPTYTKAHPQRKPFPRKFLSMAQYNKLADEMRGYKNSRHHPSYKSHSENYKSRSMKERREFREMQNVYGLNSHKKFAHTFSGTKVNMSTLYRIDEEDISDTQNESIYIIGNEI